MECVMEYTEECPAEIQEYLWNELDDAKELLVGVCISPCETMPCRNGGVCKEVGYDYDEYECECPDGFTGKDCEFGKHLFYIQY